MRSENVKIGPVPEHLGEAGRRKFEELVRRLDKLGKLTQLRDFAEQYAAAYEDWLHARRQLEETGGAMLVNHYGNAYPNPWATEADRQARAMRALLTKMHLGPSGKVKAEPLEAEENPRSRIVEMMRGSAN